MFTGIIEEVGTLAAVERTSMSAHLRISASEVLEGTRIGDSIAVSGVCLTVVDVSSGSFTADAMPETLKRSTLGGLRTGDRVNLERALLPTTRLGGHIVSGHIDGVASISSIERADIAKVITFSAPEGILRYIVEKGSVAVDGVSLTVSAVTGSTFSVSVIPHTLESTTLDGVRSGSMHNVECDMVGKYVERLAASWVSDGASEGSSKGNGNPGLSMGFLAENGFLEA